MTGAPVGRTTAVVGGMAVVMALGGCGDSGDPAGPPAGVTATVEVSPATMTIDAVGATQTLTVVVRDGRGTVLTGRTPTWHSSAPAVATVDAAGLVRAEANGNATIVATVDGKSGQTMVTVSQQVVRLVTSRVAGPANSRAGEPFTVTVEAQDAGGARVAGYSAPVTIALAPNAAMATLGGVTSLNAVDGMARFDGVMITRAGTGYFVVGTSGSLAESRHGPFAIDAGPLARLAFTTQPSRSEANLLIAPRVRVEQRDQYDNPVTADGSVTLSLLNAPWLPTRLTGTLTRPTTLGVAEFDDLRMDRPGAGFRLRAAAGNVSVQSDPFDVIVTFSRVAVGGTNLIGSAFACGIATGGTFCWGDNEFGQLGSSRAAWSETVPFLVDARVSFVQVTAGYAHACGLTAAGEVWCWGAGGKGELGDGLQTGSSMPVRVTGSGPGGGRVYSSIDAGQQHTCGLVANAVYCWGSNTYGEMGGGSIGGVQPSPARVNGSGVAPLVFTQVTAGFNRSCGVTTSKAAWCWGSASQGALGDGQQDTDRSQPVQVAGSGVAPMLFAAISTGMTRTCAVTTGLPKERAYCWGSNLGGLLGIGTFVPDVALTPMAVAQPVGANLRSVSVGHNTICADDVTPAVWCWGRGVDGEIGNGTPADAIFATLVSAPTGGIGLVSAGGASVCAVHAAGQGVYCWGTGPLGDGTLAARSIPTRIVQ